MSQMAYYKHVSSSSQAVVDVHLLQKTRNGPKHRTSITAAAGQSAHPWQRSKPHRGTVVGVVGTGGDAKTRRRPAAALHAQGEEQQRDERSDKESLLRRPRRRGFGESAGRGKGFSQAGALQEAQRSSNSSHSHAAARAKRPYYCAQCGKSFSKMSNLKAHLRTHTGEKPFGCGVCGKGFNESRNMKAHLRIHTGEKPFHCAACGKSFTESGNLQAHLRTHTQERPFHCVLCGKRFNEAGTLRAHQRIHTGEKPFYCTRCGKSFRQMGALKRHLLTHGAREQSATC